MGWANVPNYDGEDLYRKKADFRVKLRPEADPGLFDGYLTEMFNLPTFHCFILLQERKLLALSFIRSQRVGQQLFSHIQDWAVRNHRQ
jgi:hypothetical protein